MEPTPPELPTFRRPSHIELPTIHQPATRPLWGSSHKAGRTGQKLGNYRLIRLLAEGGFSEVYLGEHIHLNRYAAIKVVNAQLSSEDLEEFRKEARIVARLRHPHIVSILDFDVQDDTPFLVMDYAPNGTLRLRHPKGAILSPAIILTYLKQVAGALQYAHDERLIHRDVKPENMLIGQRDEVLLSDFGIAVILYSSHFQTARDIAGTISYIAPEQLEGKPCQASDQYALGVVVYEWLCGDCPFHGSITEIAAQHIKAPPPSLCERVPNISPALENVVLKTLSKSPEERFSSVLDFVYAFESAAHPHPLQLHLLNDGKNSSLDAPDMHYAPTIRPTEQGLTPEVLPNQERKGLLSRRALLLSLAGIATLGLTGGGITWYAQRHSYKKSPPKATPKPTPTPTPLGTVFTYYTGHPKAVLTVAWAPGSNSVASGSADNIVHVWEAYSGVNAFSYGSHTNAINALAWSPDGKRIVSASADKTVQVWDATSGGNELTYSSHTDVVRAVAWSPAPNSLYIASAGADKAVRVWKVADGSDVIVYTGHSDAVNAVVWSPDGTYIASASADKTVQVWKAATGEAVLTYHGHSDVVNALAWSLDGTYIASGSSDKTIHIWKALSGDGSDVVVYTNHGGAINTVAWSPNGTHIASGSADNTVRIWSASDGSNFYIYGGHSAPVHAITWSTDGTAIASGADDTTIQVWQAS